MPWTLCVVAVAVEVRWEVLEVNVANVGCVVCRDRLVCTEVEKVEKVVFLVGEQEWPQGSVEVKRWPLMGVQLTFVVEPTSAWPWLLLEPFSSVYSSLPWSHFFCVCQYQNATQRGNDGGCDPCLARGGKSLRL